VRDRNPSVRASLTGGAPLRTLIYVDPDGDTELTVDQPSLLFESYARPEIATVGMELDAPLARLIGRLGGEVSAQLNAESADARLLRRVVRVRTRFCPRDPHRFG
jgi:hypothetical protein